MSNNNPPNIFGSLGPSSTPNLFSTNSSGPNASAPSLFANNAASNTSKSAKPPPVFGQTSSLGTASFRAPGASPSLGVPPTTSSASNTGNQSSSFFGVPKNNTTPMPMPTIGSSSAAMFGGTQLNPNSTSDKSPFSSLPAGSLFGSGAQSSNPNTGETQPSLFGAKPATTSSDTVAQTSNQQQATGTSASSLFGNTPNTSNSNATLPVSNLFANAQKKQEGGQLSSTPSLFSSLPPKPVTAESAKDDKTNDQDASKSDNKANSVFILGSSKDTQAKLFEGCTSTPSAPAPTGSTTTPASTTVPAPSMLRGKTVEDIVNRWTTDLETQARAFSQFASEVAVWDRTLVENGNYISALYAAVIQAESTQASLDQTLEHVEQQQHQLISTLDQYEKTTTDVLHGPGGVMASTEGLGLVDSERDKSYALAANLYTQLDDLSHSLTQMVDAINGLNISTAPKAPLGEHSNDDPISAIAGILNAHLSSLQWIDGSLREMESKVKDAERKIHDVGNTHGLDGFSKVRSFGLSSSRR
ncbi:hypothetical protein Clacol_001500 [Clathrus columnatus]|uniref:Nucleoporin NSP1 n=1 Tax=Clathrus columnatus TaxID=1419009 RepID=A0AAV5A5X3_9AGAM|nr:hypothetical protein Clacol_001500 [Clathrus columnatus]